MNKLPVMLALAVAFAAVSVSAEAAIVRPKPKTPNASTSYHCSSELGLLRRVHVYELEGVWAPENVWVTPICEGEDDGTIRNEGNASALRSYIGDNPVLDAALTAANFRPEDVVGVRMTGDETVILYVSPFHR